MRLWTIHPKHLDARGLTALWREGLLARHVLRGTTKGYRHHPQLERFKASGNAVRCVDRYLYAVYQESKRRGYHFDRAKIGDRRNCGKIPATKGQLLFEWDHFRRKVKIRNAFHFKAIEAILMPEANPVFDIVDGQKEPWEKQ